MLNNLINKTIKTNLTNQKNPPSHSHGRVYGTGTRNMSLIQFDVNKDKIYTNSKGELHREDGPAIEFGDGGEDWFKHGKRHRLDGPAITNRDGTYYWFIENVGYKKEEWMENIKNILNKNEASRIILEWS
jgi:hypothetical protein